MKKIILFCTIACFSMLIFGQNSTLELEGPTSKISFIETIGGAEKAYIQYNGKDVHVVTNETNGFIFLDAQESMGVRIDGATKFFVDNMGEVGLNTSTPSARLHVNGFTRLGITAPKIKMKELTGNAPSTQGTFSFIAHGLDPSKILSVSIFLYTGVLYIPPNSVNVGAAGYEYSYHLTSSNVAIHAVNGNSLNILNDPVRILITYKE